MVLAGTCDNQASHTGAGSGHLNTLKLPTFLREYDELARQCAAEGIDHVRYLLRLAELELIERERRMVERRIKEARFPAAAGKGQGGTPPPDRNMMPPPAS